jgi:hypothetical protein
MTDLNKAYQNLLMHHVRQCNKHGLHHDADEYARAQINNLNNVELIENLIVFGEK